VLIQTLGRLTCGTWRAVAFVRGRNRRDGRPVEPIRRWLRGPLDRSERPVGSLCRGWSRSPQTRRRGPGRRGFRVEPVQSGVDAIRELEQSSASFRALVTDIDLPGGPNW